ncbi:MAG TPA: DUF996 domain-containing protein [Geobacterales bacterium]|nr:DUF996 domain-containing protein [Geobacterales bacterium]
MTLRDGKLLGGIGAILLLIPYLDLVGFILVLIGLKFISDEVKRPSIFNNALYAVILGIIGLGIIAISGFSIIGSLFINIFALLFTAILIAVGAVILILGMWFFRRALDETGDTFNQSYFKTAGLLFFIGAILAITIIGFIVTFILFLIAAIFLILAFFSLPDQYTPPAQPAPTP